MISSDITDVGHHWFRPLPEPWLTYHPGDPVPFIWEQILQKILKVSINKLLIILKLHFPEAKELISVLQYSRPGPVSAVVSLLLSSVSRNNETARLHRPLAYYINSSPPGQNGHHLADNIFRCIFVNQKFAILITISLKFVPKGPFDNKPPLV